MLPWLKEHFGNPSSTHVYGRRAHSAVLLAMGLEASTALGAVRLSLGRGTTRKHVQEAARALVRAWKEVSLTSSAAQPLRP